MARKRIESYTEYDSETFKGTNLQAGSITDSSFSSCRFVRCTFSETEFRWCRFINCTFEHCTLRLWGINGTTFGQVVFNECDLLGVKWAEANWSDWTAKIRALEFHTCNLKYNGFFGLNLQKLKIIGCTAHEANFAEADLTAAQFAGTDLEGAIFLRTNLTKADFSQAKNYTLNLQDNTTKDAKFALPAAIRLLHHLDILLVDPETGEPLEARDLLS